MYKEQFLEEGRIDQFDCTIARSIYGEDSWLGLWVSRAYRKGFVSVHFDTKCTPSLKVVFVNEYACPIEKDIIQHIEEKIASEIETKKYNTDALIEKDHSFALRRAYTIEKRVQEHAIRLKNAPPFIQSPIREIDSSLCNKDQYKAIATASAHTICALTGGPGTGKTYTAGTWLQHMVSSSPIALKVALVAPTGRAVQTLEASIRRFVCGSIQIEAKTIHSMVQTAKNTMIGYHIVIIDECSMIDSALFLRLLQRIHSGVRIIMLGDIDQLPAIEPGQPFAQMQKYVPSAALSICQRTDVPHILELSTKIRQREDVEGWFEKPTTDVCMRHCQSPEEWKDALDCVEQEIADMWRNQKDIGLSMGRSKVILTPVRKGFWGTESCNQRIAKKIGKKNLEPVVVSKNSYQLDLMNGELGILEKGEPFDWLHFAHKRIPLVLCPHIEKAYAMTVHKSQGGEFDTVFFIFPPGALVDRRVLYTAITRAKKRLVILAHKEEFFHSIVREE